MHSNSFGDRLRSLLKQSGMSQQDFADALNIPRNTVWRWINSKATPESNNLQLIADFFNISVDNLLTEPQPQHWTLQIKIADDIKEDFIDMTKDMPCVASIVGNPYGATLEVSGNWDTFADDDKFNSFIQEVINSREAILQLKNSMSKSWSKKISGRNRE